MAALQDLLTRASAARDKAKALYQQARQRAGETAEALDGPAAWTPAAGLDGLVAQGQAVAILLALLHLGIQGIRLGPSLPAFVTEPVLEGLVETFGIAPVTTPQEDLAAILG